MKLCVDCKYFRHGDQFTASRFLCLYRTEDDPQPRISPVTGETLMPSPKQCGHERGHEHLCGPDGDNFEPRPPEPPPLRQVRDGDTGFLKAWTQSFSFRRGASK